MHIALLMTGATRIYATETCIASVHGHTCTPFRGKHAPTIYLKPKQNNIVYVIVIPRNGYFLKTQNTCKYYAINILAYTTPFRVILVGWVKLIQQP